MARSHTALFAVPSFLSSAAEAPFVLLPPHISAAPNGCPPGPHQTAHPPSTHSPDCAGRPRPACHAGTFAVLHTRPPPARQPPPGKQFSGCRLAVPVAGSATAAARQGAACLHAVLRRAARAARGAFARGGVVLLLGCACSFPQAEDRKLRRMMDATSGQGRPIDTPTDTALGERPRAV